MIIKKVFKLGNRAILSLDASLPVNFKNHIDVLIEGVVYHDAILPMTNGDAKRADVSIMFNGNDDIVGKELKFLF
ncbi:hypothetical protein J7S27_04240 [Carnobacteriaceae bacterium zg-C25]|nr:hypothetical protein J7S27_04240 [Carnobacteriaceae bacterium zg-C25]